MFFSKLINFLFPIICIGCEREGDYLCKECKSTLQAHPELCPVCHKNSPTGNVCLACNNELPALDGVSVAFMYEKCIKKLILDLKFHHRYQTGQYLGQKLALLIASDPFFNPETTLITHVPSHRWRRHVQKGYNQSEILAETVAQELGIPHIALITKTRHTRSQIKLSRAKRKSNVSNAFSYQPSEYVHHAIQTVIIVDDIVTTSSTLHEIGSILKQYHPKLSIKGAVIARNAG